MIEIQKSTRTCFFADSGYEAVQWLRANPKFAWSGPSQGGSRVGALGTLGVNYDQALDLVEEGWHEGVALMNTGLQTLLATNAPGINRWKHDVAGEQPDIYRAIAGEPASMRRRNFSKGSKPIIHIVVNTAMQGSATDVQTANYGVALLGLIDFLESRGKRVELDRLGVVTGTSGNWGNRSLQGWKVKRAEESPDLAAIAFAIAHPAAHRKIVWALREHGRYFRETGSAASITREDAIMIGSPDAILIDSVAGEGMRCNSPQGALRLAAERLNRAAGETLIDMEEIG
jgi:hypothetical protein